MKLLFVVALGALALVTSAAATGAVTKGGLSSAACTTAGKDVRIGGNFARIYCGPAKATVHFGGETMTFRNGTCSWSASSFQLHLGTIFLPRPRPLPAQPGFEIYATGVPVARALIEVYWRGKNFGTSTLHATARPGAGQSGGTFQGTTGRDGKGPAISGTITC